MGHIPEPKIFKYPNLFSQQSKPKNIQFTINRRQRKTDICPIRGVGKANELPSSLALSFIFDYTNVTQALTWYITQK